MFLLFPFKTHLQQPKITAQHINKIMREKKNWQVICSHWPLGPRLASPGSRSSFYPVPANVSILTIIQ